MFLPTGRLFWKAAILADAPSVIDSFRGSLYRGFEATDSSSQHGIHAMRQRITEEPGAKEMAGSFGNRLKK
jgi:hypothetical protein